HNTTISATGGQALNLATGAFAAGSDFVSITSTGGVHNVSLASVTGSVDLGGGALSGATGSAFLVGDGAGTANTGGTAAITYSGTIGVTGAARAVDIEDRATGAGAITLSGNITQTSGTATGIFLDDNVAGNVTFSGTTNTLASTATALSITDQIGGTVTFSNTLKIDTTSTGTGVNLVGNTGSTVTFSGGGNGLDITTGSGIGFNATGGGTINVAGSGNTINTGAATALDLESAAIGSGNVTFASVTSGGGTNGIKLVGVTGGSITLSGGSLSGSTGPAFLVGDGGPTANAGGTAAITYAGTITTTGTARAVDIQDRAAGAGDITLSGAISHASGNGSTIFLDQNAAGTVLFSGANSVANSGTQDAIHLTNNTGATINFTGGGLDIDTTSGAGFSATGGGTVSLTGTGNTITTTTGTGVNIATPTNIGASGVTFQSITVNNGASASATNAIILNGTTGAFTVTGDGSQVAGLYDRDGTGGTLNRTSGISVLLTNASNVTLRKMNITNSALDGVKSTGGGNIVLSAVDINTPGFAAPGPGGDGFGTGNGWRAENITGVNSFDNNSRVVNWQGSQSNAIFVHSTDTNFTSFTVDHALISTSATGAAGFHANLNGATTGQVSLTNSEYTLIDQNAAQILNNGSGTIRAIVQGNNFHDADATGGDGNNTLFLANSHEGHLNFTIGGAGALGNTFHNLARLTTLAGVIQVDAAGGDNTTPAGGTINGTITNNNISNDAGFVNGRRAIDVQVEADSHNLGPLAVAITNNTVNNVQGTAIHISVVSVGNGSVTDGNWTITGNNLGSTSHVGLDNTDSASAIEFKTNVDAIASSTAVLTNKLLVSNNTAVNKANNATGGTLDISNIGGSGAGGLSTLNATITNNTLTNQDTAGTGHVLDVLNSSASTHETLNLNITGNNTTLGASTAGEIRLRVLNGTMNIQNGLANVSTNNNNDTVVSTNTNGVTTGTFGTAASVPLPAAPSFLEASPSGGVETATWRLVGIDDFNGDGADDLLSLRSDGLLRIDTANSAGELTNWYIPGQLQAGWHIIGIGDINGDGTSDIVLKNDNGAYRANLIQHMTVASTVDLALVNGVLREVPVPAPEAPASDPAPADPIRPSAGDPTGAPAQAAADPGAIETHLTQAELDAMVQAAIERWAAAGLSADQIAALQSVTFDVADMSGLYLGSASPHHVSIDADAAGYGWYIDATPQTDTEFAHALAGTQLQTDPTLLPAGHIDLLTTVMHEMGHQLGLDDSYSLGDRADLMYGYLVTGERRLPGAGEADGATAFSIGHEEFAIAPVTIGVLPAGKTVTIQFQAKISAQSNQLIQNPSNAGTVSGSNFATFNTNTVVTQLDTLSLGNLVFNDINFNGTYDAAIDSGVNGVALTLFADKNANNVVDAGDGAAIATTTTAGGGLYSFTGLAPGKYIVRVDVGNFAVGGALENLPNSTLGNPGPDNNVDNDDN
ncbi:MAG: hypothetical protein QOI07_3561, partial [Verrucomicrobiota bacterium]